MKNIRILLTSLFLALFLLQPVHAGAAAPVALVMTIDGAITQATQDYVVRGIQTAEQQQAELVILQLNTPGGDILSMTGITEAMRASTVPVIVYVTPRGAMAASAGTVITLAAHASAMAPETIIGAASPVGSQGQDLGQTELAKQTNALVAKVDAFAERRGPQAVALAEATVKNAKAVSSTQALQAHLVDFSATDLNDLLRQLDDFTVQMPNGPLTLHTSGIVQQALPMSLIEQLLQLLIDPNIVFLLLAIGLQALLIELTHPGAWVPAFFGVVCLALGAYGLGFLPVNLFGLIFMVTAFILFIIDIKAPTHGALIIAGIVSFIIGALVLFNSPGTPRFEQVSLPLVLFVGIFIGAIFAVILGFALRAQGRPVITGREHLEGLAGLATSEIDPSGQAQVAGELWSVDNQDAATPIHRGERVEVVKVEGLRLKVKKKG
ncbi:MAG TPA: nodulation protein NfeD [Anaerolineales bacterium]|nr:nodulation protein NfeD [Anaerolineales bacterium]